MLPVTRATSSTDSTAYDHHQRSTLPRNDTRPVTRKAASLSYMGGVSFERYLSL